MLPKSHEFHSLYTWNNFEIERSVTYKSSCRAALKYWNTLPDPLYNITQVLKRTRVCTCETVFGYKPRWNPKYSRKQIDKIISNNFHWSTVIISRTTRLWQSELSFSYYNYGYFELPRRKESSPRYLSSFILHVLNKKPLTECKRYRCCYDLGFLVLAPIHFVILQPRVWIICKIRRCPAKRVGEKGVEGVK